MADNKEEIVDTRPKAMLIKTYHEKRRSNDGKSMFDTIQIYYRTEDGKKHCKCIHRPLYTYYLLKNKNDPAVKHSPIYIEKEYLNEINIPYDQLYLDIATRTDTLGYYDYIKLSSNTGEYSSGMKNLFRLPEVYNADLDLEDFYIAKFYEQYQYTPLPLHKCYFDIETDLTPEGPGVNEIVGFPKPNIAPAPVNIITLIDGKSRNVYLFTVEDKFKKNKSYKDFLTKQDEFKIHIKKQLQIDSVIKDDIFTSDNEYLRETVQMLSALLVKYNNDDKNLEYANEYAKLYNERVWNAIQNKLVEPKFIPNEIIINNYAHEKDAIISFFNEVHRIDPDYIFGWNSADFDTRTLVRRLANIYESDPEFINTVRESPLRQAAFDVCDKRYLNMQDANNKIININPVATSTYDETKIVGERFSSFRIIDGVNWIDQEELYGIVHSGEGVKDSYSLDFTAYSLLGAEKLEFPVGVTIRNVWWKDFWLGAEYNIRDVLLLFLIDDYTKDCELLDTMATIMYTRREKAFSQATALHNYISFLCKERGFVMNSNKNRGYGEVYSDYFKQNYLKEIPIVETNRAYLEEFLRIDSNGALCSDPTLNNEVGIEVIKGRPSMYLFNTAIDFDFSSLYPSITTAFNIDQLSLIGRFILIDEKIYDRLCNKYGFKKISPKNDLGEELVDYIMSQDWNTLGSHFLGVKSINDMILELRTKV